ncbi:hypothetical protein PPERSA_13078 [Pseudocohnilembus persalinus]|uniref:Amine oxidase domain-containing protein n=1 Tax=Pseudocohnilembus persalinus TaxID=266149 RepID=A0A0V0QWG8_PSEPJ|nr:hypothetical protein PPERSA_13078 [Pseudocohnilembus persalinus]|eukprot:KRX06599.1 hypothetical protein PPERSA_13078 [Pseudocohnilembus persalinus]
MEIIHIIQISILVFLFVIFKKILNYYLLKEKLSKKNKYQEVDVKHKFNQEEIPKKIDYLIIGAGTSGLTAAAVLSKLKYKVLVLESLGKCGGTLHTFGKNKIFEFDTGIHYLGNNKLMRKLLEYICSKPIVWKQYDKFDTVKLGKDTFEFSAPQNSFFGELFQKFPENKNEIQKYIQLSQRAVRLYRWLTIYMFFPKLVQISIEFLLRNLFSDVYGKSTLQVFDEIGISKNKKLAFLLNINVGQMLGANSENTPFILHASYLQPFIKKGQIYPEGGPKQIVQSLMSTIQSNKGVIMMKSKVQKIIVKNNAVTGILVNDIEIPVKNIISSAGIETTRSLLDPDHSKLLENKYTQKNDEIQKEGQDFNTFYMFYGIKSEAIKNPITENTWVLPQNKDYSQLSYDQYLQKYSKSVNLKEIIHFISFPSYKSNPQSETISVTHIGHASRKMVEKYYKQGENKKREEGYKEFKEELEKEMTSVFLENFPQFKDKIEATVVATPLTIQTYYNRKQPYGLALQTQKVFDINHFRETFTYINGLYLTGQDTAYAGVFQAVLMGYISALKASYYL